MDRKALIREYKGTPRPAGVYRVVNSTNGRTLLGTSTDAPAMLNRHRAQLRMGGHPNRALQRDWEALGPDRFTFEVVDTLTAKEDTDYDPTDDLRLLEELWIAKLELSPDLCY